MRAAQLTELLAIVRWTLTREEDAAATIQQLCYRVDPDSDLAMKARGYAAELRQFVTRIKLVLPKTRGDAAADAPEPNCAAEAVMRGLSQHEATAFLVRFLVQHAETTCEILTSAGAKLNSKAVEKLWQQAERERRKLAAWVHELERKPADVEVQRVERGSAIAKREFTAPANGQLVIWM